MNKPSDNSSNEDLQRFAELGRLSASLLHEISSPLTTALIHLEQVSDQKSRSIRAIRSSLIHLTRYVNAARKQLRRQSETTNFDVASEVKDVKRLVMPLAQSARVKLVVDPVPHIKLRGDTVKFQQILVNLIINAIEAYPRGHKLSSKRQVRLQIINRADSAVIVVRDWGSGISEQQLPKLFEPFYTTKAKNEEGLGLGLVIVKNCVTESFKGSIKVTSSRRSGTRFSVKLPQKT